MEKLPDTLEEILQRSIELEQEGYNYYVDSAKKISNSVGKRMLERLAGDEKNHIDRFTQLYEAHTNNNIENIEITEFEPTTFDMVFNRLKEQLEGAVDELGESAVDDAEILEMAIDLENTTRFFYQDASKSASDPKIKKFYELLAEEEKAHYDALRKAMEFLDDPSLFFGMQGKL
ncbi:MAG: ferritin family protein [Calditrichaceae bacterium]